MMKILTAAALVSLSLTGVSLAQDSGGSNFGGTGGSVTDGTGQSGSDGSDGANQGDLGGNTTNGSSTGNNSGDQPQCPPGQKSADSTATAADPKCVAE